MSELERLRTGLDDLEALARMATELPAVTPWEPEQWEAARDDVRTVNGRADPLHTLHGLQGTRSRAVARFIAARDPADALKWVEAIRRVIADQQLSAEVLTELRQKAAADPEFYAENLAFERGYHRACEMFLSALASIYPDPTEES